MPRHARDAPGSPTPAFRVLSGRAVRASSASTGRDVVLSTWATDELLTANLGELKHEQRRREPRHACRAEPGGGELPAVKHLLPRWLPLAASLPLDAARSLRRPLAPGSLGETRDAPRVSRKLSNVREAGLAVADCQRCGRGCPASVIRRGLW